MESVIDTTAILSPATLSNALGPAVGKSSQRLAPQMDPDFMKMLRARSLKATAENIELVSAQKLHSAKFSDALGTMTSRFSLIESIQRSLG